MLARAEALLQRGETVILDASWTHANHRDAANEVANRTHTTLVALQCEAATEIAVARLRQRAPTISDADERIAAAIAAHTDPWPQATAIRTDDTPDRSLQQAIALVRPHQPAHTE